MDKRAELNEMLSMAMTHSFPPWKIIFDPVPDWFRTIDKDQWFRFQELEIEIQKKELDLQQHRIKNLRDIMK